MSLSQDNRQYLIYIISLFSCPYTPLSITICDLLMLFTVGKTDYGISSRLWPNGCLPTNQPSNPFFCMGQWCWWCWMFIFSLPLGISHSCINAGRHAKLFDSCPLWSDAWQAATEPVVWVSWRVAALGTRQGLGTDVEEGGGRTLQDLFVIWDTGWTPERWSQGKRGRDEYKASNLEGRSKNRSGD